MFKQTLYVVLTLISAIHGIVVICKQRDPCRCQTDSADINLHSISTTRFPSFSWSEYDVEYTYSPCKGKTCGKGVTNDTLCASWGKGRSFKDLGDIRTFKFQYDQAQLRWSIDYKSKDNKTNSTVNLLCDCSSPSLFRFVSFNVSKSHYLFNLTSPHVCPNVCPSHERGLSPGTVLLLIFFSILLIYFGVGILYRKTVYGAEGREVIPHTTFWFSLPGLVRDGYLFFISPCLGERVEYRYYDRL